MDRRSNPFDEIDRMLENLNRRFEEMSRDWDERGEFGRTAFASTGIDLADHGDEFVVTADLPGFETDDVDLRFDDGTLQIRARRERTEEREGETYIRSEREHREMTESVRLPDPIKEDEITANLKNGVLTVHLPKAEPTEAGGRRIDIE